MKYFNFKRFKFSTIFKKINFKRYERIPAYVAEFVISIIEYVFSRIYKSFNFIGHHFLKTYNNINFKKYNFYRIDRYINIKRLDFTKVVKYLKSKRYYIYRIKRINFVTSKFLFFHLPLSVIFFGFLYLIIPTFYSYDKSNIEDQICRNKDILPRSLLSIFLIFSLG